MPFDDAPLYLLGPEIRAKQFADARTISISDKSKTVTDQVFVPAGHWGFLENGVALELDNATFLQRFIHVGPDSKSFVERSRPVRAAIDGNMVNIDGRDQPMPLSEFIKSAVRVADDGRPLCRLDAPLWQQAQQLIALKAVGKKHVDSIVALRDQLAASVQDMALWTDLNMLDAILAGRKDTLSDGMASLHAMKPPSGIRHLHQHGDVIAGTLDPASVRGLMAISLGIHPAAILDVTQSPTYQNAAFRALARSWLSPYLGSRTLEEALVLQVPAGEKCEDIRHTVERWLAQGELLCTGPKVKLEGAAGYETSPLQHYRLAEGLDAVMFEDMAGVYVYAWQTPGVPALRMTSDDNREPPRLH